MTMLDTITRCAGYQVLSDDQLANERKAQELMLELEGRLVVAISEINALSTLIEIDPKAVGAFIHDEFPLLRSWNQKIAEARRA